MPFGLVPITTHSAVQPLSNSYLGTCLLFAAIGLTVSGAVVAFPDGPEPGYTGGKGFEDCSGCHFAGPPPSTGSGIELTGLAEQMVPGERYQITIEVRDPEQQVGGFQLAIRNLSSLASDGQFVEREGLRILVDANVTFLSHSEPQRAEQQGDHQLTRWQFEWVAGSAKKVELSVAAVAADGDDSSLGDNVYTFSRIISTN